MAEKGGLWPHGTVGSRGGGSSPRIRAGRGGEAGESSRGSAASAESGRMAVSPSGAAEDEEDGDREDKRQRVIVRPESPPAATADRDSPMSMSGPAVMAQAQQQQLGARTDYHHSAAGPLASQPLTAESATPPPPLIGGGASSGAAVLPADPGGLPPLPPPPGSAPGGSNPPPALQGIPWNEVFWRVAEGAARTRAAEFTHARRDLAAIRELIPGIEIPADDLELDLPVAGEGLPSDDGGATDWQQWEDSGFN